jgi:predicted alpha/beta superfamily hydrolase
MATFPAPETSTPHSGEFRIHKRFRSRFLTVERNLIVYLPPDFDKEPLRRYPVLYMQDGQNLFDVRNAIGKEWHADDTIQSCVNAGEIEPLIAVGIYHAHERRIDEYTPTRDRKQRRGGHAGLYGRMLVEEVKPFIDSAYRTRRDAMSTGLVGSSLGGLVSLWLGLQYPRTFGKLGVLSPSVWWDNRAIVRDVRALGSKPALKLWLSTGTNEGRGVRADARRLRDALIDKGWTPGDDLMYYEAQGAGHDEHAWAALLGPALRFLFPPYRAGRDLSGLDRL